MELLKAIQNDVQKQREEAEVNLYSCVADFREFISATEPAADVSVTLKLCCLSSERVIGGRGTRVTGIDASQRSVFELTANALHDLTPLKRKPYLVQVTVWDAKPKKGSYGKSNMESRPGAVYTFHQVDGVGFYADIAKGSVQYERDNTIKIYEEDPPPPPSNKRKTQGEVLPSSPKSKSPATSSGMGTQSGDDESDYDMADEGS
ncbi:NADH-cytochrome b5 reductase [Phytophthora cinnamomi]|uniref:NADH-cytochrome b5 reductase n=1 Tax=Phytophthora cinnamomi TaxID=4785 RepID=UPI0035599D43|nr:NADH-cytochrome b5 reductase [Phytophthora cinnamomi]